MVIYIVSKDAGKVVWDASRGLFQGPIEVAELLQDAGVARIGVARPFKKPPALETSPSR